MRSGYINGINPVKKLRELSIVGFQLILLPESLGTFFMGIICCTGIHTADIL